MSEATLKRKSLAKYNNMSVGSKNGGFSINGTRRSQGYIGRGVLGLHFPRTPMRGNEPRGSGGCCGTYPRKTIVQSGVPYPTNINGSTANNNPNVVKPSVLDTNGLLMTKYRWIRRPQPFAVVKPDTNLIQSTQQSYIENLSKNTVATLNECNPSYIFHEGGIPSPGWYSITNTAENTPKLGPTSQGVFIQTLGGLCTKNNKLPKTNTRNAPFAC
jgi:hypothetical protein